MDKEARTNRRSNEPITEDTTPGKQPGVCLHRFEFTPWFIYMAATKINKISSFKLLAALLVWNSKVFVTRLAPMDSPSWTSLT